ncbi:alpha/beta fold hydrolase [Zobellella taiwanensis]|jgi:sigma-B regulation protein RsbQ
MNASLILTRNHVTCSGQGERTLLFGHGFGCDQQIWSQVAPAFERDYRVVTFDYVGCGRADPGAYDEQRYQTLDGYALDVLEVAAALAPGPVTFVGHSVSGAIGMLAAIAEPGRFEQLIALGPSPRYLNDEDYHGGFERADIADLLDMMERNRFEWAGYLAPRVMDNPDRPELADGLRRSFLAADPVISRRFAEATFLCDIRAQLPRVSLPTSVLYCESDIIVPLTAVDYLARRLPRCRLHRLAASGHYPQVSHPRLVIDAIHQELNARP